MILALESRPAGYLFGSLLLLIVVFATKAEAQSVRGTFPALAGQSVTLTGYDGMTTTRIGQTRADTQGRFTIPYRADQRGMGVLSVSQEESMLLVLSGEDIILSGQAFSDPDTITIEQSEENKLFDRFADEHPLREQAISAWTYLMRLYETEDVFREQTDVKEGIRAEMERLRNEDQAFLAGLNPDMYISFYLPLRKLVLAVPAIAQYRTEELPGAIATFRSLDYTDRRLMQSGLLQSVLESHVWLIENSGQSLDRAFSELNHSLDLMIAQLVAHPGHLNEIMLFLFDFMEQRSLFTSSEYMALQLLENHGEVLSNRLASRLEQYRAVRVGNIAPDIRFEGQVMRPQGVAPEVDRLSAVDTDYVLVVFAAGWCPHCREMMPNLVSRSRVWKQQGVEVVMVNLDDSRATFDRFTEGAPFFITSDFQRWSTPAVRDYHVQSIPSMFLLDRDRQIVLRPNSVSHMDSWVDWFLVQGNTR